MFVDLFDAVDRLLRQFEGFENTYHVDDRLSGFAADRVTPSRRYARLFVSDGGFVFVFVGAFGESDFRAGDVQCDEMPID